MQKKLAYILSSRKLYYESVILPKLVTIIYKVKIKVKLNKIVQKHCIHFTFLKVA